MTASTSELQTWAEHPMGLAVRVGIAVTGMVTATLVLMMSAVLPEASWPLVVLGVALAATSVRAARVLCASRLVVLGAVLAAVPVVIQVF